jgi:hypothetical protein
MVDDKIAHVGVVGHGATLHHAAGMNLEKSPGLDAVPGQFHLRSKNPRASRITGNARTASTTCA